MSSYLRTAEKLGQIHIFRLRTVNPGTETERTETCKRRHNAVACCDVNLEQLSFFRIDWKFTTYRTVDR